jgi:hypothetical protein
LIRKNPFVVRLSNHEWIFSQLQGVRGIFLDKHEL